MYWSAATLGGRGRAELHCSYRQISVLKIEAEVSIDFILAAVASGDILSNPFKINYLPNTSPSVVLLLLFKIHK